ncbi:MAG: FG-GAP-like repeat-containing protein [Bacteroidota bacterium]|nr:FG-GAP-like repeat-containing protein [Bacteroidota bacterium]MDP4193847.1 FG-GAP-like repeat-containing protein [Bacteroidota bacterium]
MKRFYFLLLVISLALSYTIYAQNNFFRKDTISVQPLDAGGWGNIVAGVDLDKDGNPEIYGCNSNATDVPSSFAPRLYKFELQKGKWNLVWSTTLDVPYQNTWPALTTGDLDKDGKGEIIWCPANFLTDTGAVNTNPTRIAVFEARGDTSEAMGVDFFGSTVPNAKWTISSTPNNDMRPFHGFVMDIDKDGKNEFVYCDRQSSSGLSFGIVSVDKIPDNADGNEKWTLKMNGKDASITGLNTSSKYDIVFLNNVLYIWDSNGLVTPVKYANNSWTVLPAQKIAGTTGSFKSAQLVDINNDGKSEIVFGGWSDGLVYLCQQQGDTLVATQIGNFAKLGVTRLNGGGNGDLDSDGKIDFVFGSRNTTATKVFNAVCRLQYKGGAIADSNSYIPTIIDSLIHPNTGQLDIVAVSDVDGDKVPEVLYTSGYPRGTLDVPNIPIVILKYNKQSAVEKEKSLIPESFYLSQNFPNPFNPSTTIKFGLSKATSVTLKIYNILGEEVSTLINGEQLSAGAYNIPFNASNLASGTYVYQLGFDGQIISKKMQLLK